MVDNKKEMEREELHRAIWAIADELRGAVDGWDFKNYVLGTMFYRYISENLCNYINAGEIEAGNADFDYAKLSDEEAEEAREGLVQEKGFFILPSELFCNVRARAAGDENLNETLETVFRHIEGSAQGSESEGSFAGLFDDYDVNSNKLGATVAKRNEKLVKLLNGVADMKLGDVKDHQIDAFGDAYEYLMTMYASNAGKSGGEFFTPADVSELLTRLGTVGKTEVNKVYDPACGSGSLLLKAVKVLGRDAVRNGFYGQEINITTYNLCRINMFLHDIGFDKFDIACEDTLTNPQHWDDEPFPRRGAGPQEQGRSGLYHAQPQLAGVQRHRRHRLFPRHPVPGRGGKEDPPVPYRQQLHRLHHPAAQQPVLRHQHRHLHHGAEKEQGGQQDPVHRRLRRVRQSDQQQ